MQNLYDYLSGIGFGSMTGGHAVMLGVACVLIFLAIAKKYEPLLLLPLAFGMFIANIPVSGLSVYDEGGLLFYLYQGVSKGIYPPMIFLCIGAMTDFSPLISSPKSALIGLGGQLGIFAAFGGAIGISRLLSGVLGETLFTIKEAAAIGIIGSSDGPTSIYAAEQLAPDLLPMIAIAAYSYMSLVPLIQPPIMRLLTTKRERVIVMPQTPRISKRKKILFPIAVTLVTLFFVPSAGPLVAMLMLGNLLKESGVAERLVRALQNDALSLLTMLIGISIGATATAEHVLRLETVLIIALGLLAFIFGTAGGILIAKLLCAVTKGKVNPLIGNAGVSAMPMAARVSQKLGQQYNPASHLLMHAMGPIVSSTIGSAVLAGIFIFLLQ